jgi:xylulokinase
MARAGAILSIDLGTTRCKAAVFDLRGRMLSSAWRDSKAAEGGGGDQDIASWRRDFRWCARRAAMAAGAEIQVIAVTGQGSTAVWLDARSRQVRPIVTHTGPRSAKQLELLELLNREMGGLSYPAAKILPLVLWLRETDRSRFLAIRHVLDVRQFVGYDLTGELRFDRAAFTDAQRAKFAELSGLDTGAFGDPHDYSSPVGSLTPSAAGAIGVPPGTPVFVGPMDGLCGIIGSGINREGQLADVAGTTEVMAAAVPPASGLGILPYLDTGLVLYYTSPPFGLAYKWFVDSFYAAKGDTALGQVGREAARTTTELDSPLFIPAMKSVGYHTNLEGCFVGMRPDHTRGHLARALMECVSFELARVVEKLAQGGAQVSEIRVSGGSAYQDAWNQMKADVTGREVLLPRVIETSCLGAAIMAATSSSGPYASLAEGMEKMVGIGRRFRPRKAMGELYRQRLVRYRRYGTMLEQVA